MSLLRISDEEAYQKTVLKSFDAASKEQGHLFEVDASPVPEGARICLWHCPSECGKEVEHFGHVSIQRDMK
jgi:hypothetical protein